MSTCGDDLTMIIPLGLNNYFVGQTVPCII